MKVIPGGDANGVLTVITAYQIILEVNASPVTVTSLAVRATNAIAKLVNAIVDLVSLAERVPNATRIVAYSSKHLVHVSH